MCENFLFGLLGKRKRRILILARWHIPGESIQEIVQTFFQTLLYEPIQISLFPDYFRVFPVNGLNIYYNWLTSQERAFIAKLYVERNEFFTDKNFYVNGNFCLRGPKLDFPLVYRRELVRDFVNLLILKYSKEAPMLPRYVLVYVCQQMMLKKTVDRFILELHSALQGMFNLDLVHCRFT